MLICTKNYFAFSGHKKLATEEHLITVEDSCTHSHEVNGPGSDPLWKWCLGSQTKVAAFLHLVLKFWKFWTAFFFFFNKEPMLTIMSTFLEMLCWILAMDKARTWKKPIPKANISFTNLKNEVAFTINFKTKDWIEVPSSGTLIAVTLI